MAAFSQRGQGRTDVELRLCAWAPLGNLLPDYNCKHSHRASLAQEEYEHPSRMGIWIQPMQEPSAPANVKAEDEWDSEWIVEMGKDGYQF